MKYIEQEAMECKPVLCDLAMEIQHMNELERMKALKQLIRKEMKKDVINTYWVRVAKILLKQPDAVLQALQHHH